MGMGPCIINHFNLLSTSHINVVDVLSTKTTKNSCIVWILIKQYTLINQNKWLLVQNLKRIKQSNMHVQMQFSTFIIWNFMTLNSWPLHLHFLDFLTQKVGQDLLVFFLHGSFAAFSSVFFNSLLLSFLFLSHFSFLLAFASSSSCFFSFIISNEREELHL